MDSEAKNAAGAVHTRRSLPMALLRAREVVMQHFRPMLAAHGLTEQQWRVLRVLGEDGASEAGHVAARAVVLPPSLSRILKALEAEGFVQTRNDKSDGRRTIVSLTTRGAKELQKAAPESAAIYGALEMRVGRQTLNALLDLLDELEAKLKAD